ncbi:MAG TPA: hypothetical protein DDX92_07325 [Flavobacteriales bacterium]|jgi:uncharacterized Fe-S cluster protein YjdI/CDGSH-type Zn-finger protein|nr:hypothetical protein [Flavobacteriales bacterium]
MKIKPTTKEYQKDDLTVLWKPHLCIHSEKCWRGLPDVFQYGKRPWVNPDGADANSIMAQIDQCPSGALSYRKKEENADLQSGHATKVVLMKNGPMIIEGNISWELGEQKGTGEGKTAFCRCGASGNKPFCDGSHAKSGFEG